MARRGGSSNRQQQWVSAHTGGGSSGGSGSPGNRQLEQALASPPATGTATPALWEVTAKAAMQAVGKDALHRQLGRQCSRGWCDERAAVQAAGVQQWQLRRKGVKAGPKGIASLAQRQLH